MAGRTKFGFAPNALLSYKSLKVLKYINISVSQTHLSQDSLENCLEPYLGTFKYCTTYYNFNTSSSERKATIWYDILQEMFKYSEIGI